MVQPVIIPERFEMGELRDRLKQAVRDGDREAAFLVGVRLVELKARFSHPVSRGVLRNGILGHFHWECPCGYGRCGRLISEGELRVWGRKVNSWHKECWALDPKTKDLPIFGTAKEADAAERAAVVVPIASVVSKPPSTEAPPVSRAPRGQETQLTIIQFLRSANMDVRVRPGKTELKRILALPEAAPFMAAQGITPTGIQSTFYRIRRRDRIELGEKTWTINRPKQGEPQRPPQTRQRPARSTPPTSWWRFWGK